MTDFCITIDTDGSSRFIYDDAIPVRELGAAVGALRIERASHVEPTPDGRWEADMSPVGGPASLGSFKTRSAALRSEVRWLTRNRL